MLLLPSKVKYAAMLFVSSEHCLISMSQSISYTKTSILHVAFDITTGRICPIAVKYSRRANIENMPGSAGHRLRLLLSNQKAPRMQNPPL